MAGPEDDDFDLDDDIDAGVDESHIDEEIDGAEDEAEEERETETIDAAKAGGQVEARRPNREATRIQRLANETKAARAEAAEMRRELQELKQRQAAPAPVDPRIEAERLAMMTPEERMEYRFEQSERRNQAIQAQMQFQMQDQLDKAEFSNLVGSNAKYAKYAGEVEQRLATLRAQGQNVKRDVLLKYVLGEKLVANTGAGAGAKQKAAGQARIAAQKTSPGSSKGDAPRSARGGKSLEDRLADQLL